MLSHGTPSGLRTVGHNPASLQRVQPLRVVKLNTQAENIRSAQTRDSLAAEQLGSN